VPTIEEMTTWTADDVLQEIQRVLPEGWTLSSKALRDRFRVQILEAVVEGEERVLAWEDYHVDQRILLFDAYAWLVTLGQTPSPVKGPLSRRQQLAEQAAVRWAGVPKGNIPPDPEDVDPAEVTAVYEDFRSKEKT